MKLKYIGACACAVALIPFAASAQTWTAPTQTAPAGNASAPLNVSPTSQVKAGGLSVGSLIVTGASAFGGNVGVTGDVTASAFLYSSDKTLKKGIETLTDSLSKVLGLRGVSFQWKNGGRKDIGLIAQEVEKVIPEAVHTNAKTGLKSVEYGNIVGLLIEAVKAQQMEIDALKAEVKALKK